jgi:hypothetical protein
MNSKKLTILAAILVIAVGLIVVSEKLSSKKSAADTSAFFPGFSSADCGSFQIRDKSGTVKVEQKNGQWVVGSADAAVTAQGGALAAMDSSSAAQNVQSYKADTAAVVVLLEKFQKMQRDVLVSTNPEKRALFEVDSANGIRVEVWNKAGRSLGIFYAGKNGSDYSTHYVRSEGSDQVYAVAGGIRYSLYSDLNRWRDKTIFAFEPSSIRKLTVAVKDSATIVLERSKDSTQQSSWQMTAPQTCKAKNSEADNLCLAFAKLQTSEWETAGLADTAMGLDKPAAVVTAELENGQTRTLTVGKEKAGSGNLWTKASDQDFIFLMGKYNLTKLTKGVNDLKEAAAAPTATPPAITKKAK